jgi:hypothetical protein
MLVFGLPTEIELAKYDPATDFTSVEGGCTIVSVAYSIEERSIVTGQKRTTECVDIYKYSFTKTGSTTNLISGAEEHGRCYDPTLKCDAPSSDIHPAELAVGAAVPCWSPAPNKDIPSLASFYKCGNEECVKLGGASLSPAAEYAAEKGWGQSLLLTILGALFVAISLLGCGAVVRRVLKQDPEAPVGPLHGPRDEPLADTSLVFASPWP